MHGEILGFTGSKKGLTPAQLDTFARRLWSKSWAGFVHTGVGAAAQAAHFVAIARGLSVIVYTVDGTRGVFLPGERTTLMPSRPLLLARAALVESCAVLVACPSGPENTRSETWKDILRARAERRPVVLVWPDGTVAKDEKP